MSLQPQVAAWRRGVIYVMFACVLTACGWHLRGSQAISLGFDKVVLVDNANDGHLRQQLLQRLEQAGVSLVDAEATVLTIYKPKQLRRTLTLAKGKVAEYELSYSLSFDVKDAKGEMLMARQTVEAVRVYAYDQNQALAKEREQTRLIQEMRKDVVNALMRRLQMMGREQNKSSGEVAK